MIRCSNPLLALLAATLLLSCSTDIDDYEQNEQPFDIKTYFTGDVIAWGIIQDSTQKVNRRFCVELKGTWNGNNGILAEKFYFKDGEISYRNWQLTKNVDGSYKGTAEDVLGTAIGKHKGFAFQFNYGLSLKVEEDSYQVSMDDWIYQLDEYRAINKTSVSKFGINVAEVTIFFDKEIPLKSCDLFNEN